MRHYRSPSAENFGFYSITELDKIPCPPASTRDPYGKWTCKDGREVLFDRGYCPLYSKRPGEPAEIAEPNDYPDGAKTEHFWLDGRTQPERSWKTRQKLDRLLREWGVRR
jgi:hypothetical protein